MTQQQQSVSRARRAAVRTCAVVAATGLFATLAAVPAYGYTSVPVENGDAWNVHDGANPGLDTGSIMDTRHRALQGYGGIRVQVDGGTGPLQGILLRGFDITAEDDDSFVSETGVDVDGVVVQRALDIDRRAGVGRFFDSFTNTTSTPITLDVAFGGQLGYNTGLNQTAVAGTATGDNSITAADTWASWYTPSAGEGSASQNGPSATVFGELDRVGLFLRDPFTNDLPPSGDESNHPAAVNTLSVAPGETASLVHYVVTGVSEVREIAPGAPLPTARAEVDRVQLLARDLADAPDLTGLNSAEICSIANFPLEGIDCATPAGSIQGGIDEVAAPSAFTTGARYDVVGKTIVELTRDMENGTTTAVEIARAYLDRIVAYDRGPFGHHSVISVADDLLEQAAAADAARTAGDERPLLGIPILVKDIIDVAGMPTTGGSLVFQDYMPQRDAWQVTKLREAGAIIMGKANLSEFANSGHYSESAFGQVWNAFDISRSSIGSSGGSAVSVAASFAAAAFGTQTGDSLWGPASAASLYSLRGTDGMQSSDGTMPLTLITDYVGFISQSVEDQALLMAATAIDNPNDVLDDVSNGNRPDDWTEYFDVDALRGKTIGIPAGAFTDPFGTTETRDAMLAQRAVFEAAGATVVDMPAAPPAPARTYTGDLGYEGWSQWIDAHPDNPYDLPEQITRNPLRIPTSNRTAPYTAPPRMSDEQQRAYEAWRASYRDLLADWMDASGVDAVLYAGLLSEIHLNDSINPSFGRLDPQSSASGVPTAIFPAGTNSHGSPINFQLQGKEFQDAELLGFVYAFEQARGTTGRVLPTISPALAYDAATPEPVVEPLPPLAQGVAQPLAGVLTGSASSVSENGVPWIEYDLRLFGNSATRDVVLELADGDRSVSVALGTLTDEGTLSGRVLWPGASTDEGGAPTDWPGFERQGDSWVQAEDEFAWTLDVSTAKVVLTPDLTVALSYPTDAAPPHSQPDPDGPGTGAPGHGPNQPGTGGDGVDGADPALQPEPAGDADDLARTGQDFAAVSMALGAAALVLTGAAVLIIRRRRPHHVN